MTEDFGVHESVLYKATLANLWPHQQILPCDPHVNNDSEKGEEE